MGTPHKVVAQPGSPDEGKEVDAQALMLALNGKYEDKKHGLRDRRHYIERIIDIRKQLESYEAGGLDGKLPNSSFKKFADVLSKYPTRGVGPCQYA